MIYPTWRHLLSHLEAEDANCKQDAEFAIRAQIIELNLTNMAPNFPFNSCILLTTGYRMKLQELKGTAVPNIVF